MNTFEQVGIHVNGHYNQEKTLCPKCSHNRTKSHDRCLSVNIDEGVWHCHHCGWKGSLNKGIKMVERPTTEVNHDLPEAVILWFEDRCINEQTLINEDIGYSNGWIQFPYYKNGEIVNIKSRTRDKKFKQEKNAEKCFYRWDAMRGRQTIIITEGEIDALSLVQTGFDNVVSIPDGAISPNTKGSDLKFSFLESAEEFFMEAETIILCLDSDAAGKTMRDELSRRIGREKCYKVEYPSDCKDVNDVLVKYGEERISEIITNVYPYPIDGVVTIGDVKNDAINLLLKPDTKGLTTGWTTMDDYYRVSPSEVTVITGVPNMGKSEWMDALMINMVQEHGWKFGVFSAENFPVKHHLLKLVGKFTGQPFWGDSRLSEETASNAMDVLDDHIKFIGTQEDSVTVESILEQARLLNFRYGLNGLIIDPWNTVEHKWNNGENETNYVSRILATINAFSKMHELHIWIVAHPRKMENDTNRKPMLPTPYDIAGSANWYNKCDNCITVYRHKDDDDDYVGIHVQKIRFQYKNGRPGTGKLNYDTKTGTYGTYIARDTKPLFTRDG